MLMSFHSNNTRDVFTTKWESAELTFDDIPNWIRQKNLMGYCSNLLVDGSREMNKDKNAETGIERYAGKESVLIIDIDNKPDNRTITIPQAVDIFSDLKYIIVTTKSHSDELHNFRLFLEFDTMVDDYHDRKLIMDYIYSTYPFIDQACKNCNRLFYTSPIDALVYENKEGKLFDTTKILKHSSQVEIDDGSIQLPDVVTPLPLPNQEFITKRWNGRNIRVLVNGGNEEYSGDGSFSREQSIDGVKTYLDNEFYQGNKGNAIYSASCMLCNNHDLTDDDVVDIIMSEWEQRSSSTDKFAHALSAAKNGLKTR